MTSQPEPRTTLDLPSGDVSRIEDESSAGVRAGISRVVLGPCPCQGCGQMVTWNGWWWQNKATGWAGGSRYGTHTCPPVERRSRSTSETADMETRTEEAA